MLQSGEEGLSTATAGMQHGGEHLWQEVQPDLVSGEVLRLCRGSTELSQELGHHRAVLTGGVSSGQRDRGAELTGC